MWENLTAIYSPNRQLTPIARRPCGDGFLAQPGASELGAQWTWWWCRWMVGLHWRTLQNAMPDLEEPGKLLVVINRADSGGAPYAVGA